MQLSSRSAAGLGKLPCRIGSRPSSSSGSGSGGASSAARPRTSPFPQHAPRALARPAPGSLPPSHRRATLARAGNGGNKTEQGTKSGAPATATTTTTSSEKPKGSSEKPKGAGGSDDDGEGPSEADADEDDDGERMPDFNSLFGLGESEPDLTYSIGFELLRAALAGGLAVALGVSWANTRWVVLSSRRRGPGGVALSALVLFVVGGKG
jgi:hypothetical protein